MEESTDQGRTHAHHHHHKTYQQNKNVKQGSRRLERRSAAGVHGQPKKSGHGGKFTWGGPAEEDIVELNAVVALDEKDPNYEEEEQEEENKKVSVDTAVGTGETATAAQAN